MATPKAPQLQSKPLQDSTNKDSPEPPKSFSHEKNSLSDFAKEIIRECADDPQYDNVVKVWIVVDTLCKQKKYTPEQVGKFLRYCKKKLIHEHLKEKLDSATVKEPTTNLLYVPTYLPLKRTNLTKNAPTTTNGQELIRQSLSGGVF